ncbi:MAG: primosomal protein N' [Acetobacteraceae bacterium]|nr:primosomal protein N' [Acetobacteraceae bacterium]
MSAEDGKRDRGVPVMLPLPLPGSFDYAVPEGMEVEAGDVVMVPLNRREIIGVVWDAPSPATLRAATPDQSPGQASPASGRGELAPERLKPIVARLEVPPLGSALRRFIDWTAAYTMSPPGEVMAMAMRSITLEPMPTRMGWRRAEHVEGPLTEPRRRVLAALEEQEPRTTGGLARAAGVTAGVVRGMTASGMLVAAVLPDRGFARPEADLIGPRLGEEQAKAAEVLRRAVQERRFSVALLDGVTGSGKTEVYLEAIAECLRQGRQALVLLPEIALSSQVLERFERRFGAAPATWHSDLPSRLRRVTRREVALGRAPVVVGARSALFLPFPELGLIVVDEEHEAAFKQEDGVVYHARDMAVVRARMEGAAVVLVSATPSLETMANVEAGRYRHITLPRRHGGASLPRIEAIDLRETPPERGRFLAPPLIAAVQETIGQGLQAMLFLNRRGYAPLTLCRACGHRMQCPNCTAWLVEHRTKRVLQCHHCGHSLPIPEACPECGAAQKLTPVGPGVERITEEAAKIFPSARRLIMASDTMPGPAAAADAARAIASREIDLIIGTQIVAKGWHFPHLVLVGVVDADLGLAGADLRAGERTVQLLHQVAGRAGRAEVPGRVLLQTFSPEHPVMQALLRGDLAGFLAEEAESRRPGRWPPYGRLAALIVSGETAQEADQVAGSLGRVAPSGDGVAVLGPAPAPLSILCGRHWRRLLLKTRRDVAVQPILREWLGRVSVPRTARVQVDIDPISFL